MNVQTLDYKQLKAQATELTCTVCAPDVATLAMLKGAHFIYVTKDGELVFAGDRAKIRVGHSFRKSVEFPPDCVAEVRYLYVDGRPKDKDDKLKFITYSLIGIGTNMQRVQIEQLLIKALGPALNQADSVNAAHCIARTVSEDEIDIAVYIGQETVDTCRMLGITRITEITADLTGQALYLGVLDTKTDDGPAIVKVDVVGGNLKGVVTPIAGAVGTPNFIAAYSGFMAVLVENNRKVALYMNQADEPSFGLVQAESELMAIFFDDDGNLFGLVPGELVRINTKNGRFTAVAAIDRELKFPGITKGLDGKPVATAASTDGGLWTFGALQN